MPKRRTNDDDDRAERQMRATRRGLRAERAGRPVIYIHGRPYADPDHDDDDDENTGIS